MLSPNDVISLEERWKRWNQKKIAKRFFLPFLTFLPILGVWYIYNFLSHTKAQNIQATKENQSELIAQVKTEPVKEKNESIPHSPEELSMDDNISTKPSKPRLALTIQPVPKSPQKPKVPLPESETITLDESVAPPSLPQNPPPKKEPTKPVENTAIKSVEKTQVVEEETSASKKIEIEMQPSSADSTKYLKDKFDSTGNIVFALMVSEEYYHMGQYNDSIRWALTANELDPKNERSWVLFAQSKAKLGYQKEAIMALEEFLKSNNSGKIESLLIILKQGKF